MSCYIDITWQQHYGTSYQSPNTRWRRLRAVSTKRAYNDESSFNIGCSSESKWLQTFKESLSGELPDTHNVVVEQLEVEPKEKTPNDMRVKSEESADNPVYTGKSKRPSTNKPTGKIVFSHILQHVRIVQFVSSQRLPKLRAGTSPKREETAIIIHKNLEMLHRRITKFPVRRTNLVCSIVSKSWYRTFILVGSNVTQQRIKLRWKR